jgi:hypothetical protein
MQRHRLAAAWLALCAGAASAAPQFQPPVAYPTGIAASRIAVGDLNGDARPDLVAADSQIGIAVLLNQGNGRFNAATHYSLTGVPNAITGLALCDLDGDGARDVAVARREANLLGTSYVTVLRNNGAGALGPRLAAPVLPAAATSSYTPAELACADVDGDGDRDLATATSRLNEIDQPGFISVIRNSGVAANGLPILASAVHVSATVSTANGIYAADLDLDASGDVDFAVSSALEHRIAILLNDGSGTGGTLRREVIGGDFAFPGVIDAADLNADGYPDLVVLNAFHSFTPLMNLNGGNNPNDAGRFLDQGQLPVGDQNNPPAELPAGLALGDFDGVLGADVAIGLAGDSGPGSLALLANDGAADFPTEAHFGNGQDVVRLASADLDGDGDLDVAAVTGSNALVFRNLRLCGSALDSDGDLVCNAEDNCQQRSNSLQQDADSDGFGNLCDGDFDQSGLALLADFNVFRACFGKAVGSVGPAQDPKCSESDMDSSGSVGVTDFNRWRSEFQTAPGP